MRGEGGKKKKTDGNRVNCSNLSFEGVKGSKKMV